MERIQDLERDERSPITIFPVVCIGRDLCQGVARACELGYHVMPYPGKVQVGTAQHKKGMPQGLRQSAVEMMRETQLRDGGVSYMYAESDFYPHISSDNLRKAIDRAPADWEVLQLFNNMWYEPKEQNEVVEDPEKIEWRVAHRNWGTHAVLFRGSGVVHIVSELWKQSPKPIDESLINSGLRIYCPNVNLFTQYGMGNYAERGTPRDKRFVVGMMSYKRIKDACRQIYTFMDQTYTNFIMYVSLKGIAEEEWKQRLEPNFRHFIKEGRLIVSVDPNDNQLKNLITIYNHVHPESYDLLLKVDDDDWYDREYMERINKVHSCFSSDVGSRQDIINGGFSQFQGYPIFYGSCVPVWGGSTVVYTQRVAQILTDYVNAQYSYEILEPYIGEGLAKQSWTWREDNLLQRLLSATGCVGRRYMDPGAAGLMVTSVGSSVTRGIARNNPFYNGHYTHMISINTLRGSRRMLISASRCAEMEDKGKRRFGQIISKQPGEYVIRWDKDEGISVLVHRSSGLWDEVSS